MFDKTMMRIFGVCLVGVLSATLFTACKQDAPSAQAHSDAVSSQKAQESQILVATDTKKSHHHNTNTKPLCNNQLIHQSYQQQRSNVQVQGCGKVKAVLADDNEGSRHQKFIVSLEGVRQTVLIAHNIDLAPRVAKVQKGDWVDFYGEYEFSDKGGVVHWTHHDPASRHQHGYIEHQGKRYQ